MNTTGTGVDHYATPPQRHRHLSHYEDQLAAISYGNEAHDIDTTSRAALVLAPTVIWLSGPSTWTKSRRGLLPHHLRWSTNQRCLALPPGTHRLAWITTSWGRRMQGTIRINVDGSRIARTVHQLPDSQLHGTDQITLGVSSTRTLKQQQKRLIEAAEAARWTLLTDLTEPVRRRVSRAAWSISNELDVNGPILDQLGIDTIVDALILGDRDTDGPSPLNRRIDRYAASTTRPAADFYQYLCTSVYRDAALAIRRKIDDPRWVGTALRRFRANHLDLDLDELLTAFNRTQPRRDQVSYDRAWRSLVPKAHPAPTPNADIDALSNRVIPA